MRVRSTATIFRRFLKNRQGSAVAVLGLAAPVAFGLVGVAVDYSIWVNQTGKLRRAADAAALIATRELSVSAATEARVQAVAESVVASHHRPADGFATPSVVASLQHNRTGVKVVVRQERKAYLARMVASIAAEIEVSATARASGNRKTCVLALDPTKGSAIKTDASARLTGNDCAIYSNSTDKTGFVAQGSSLVSAALICSSGGFEGGPGNFTGQRLTDCPPQPDPLASRPPPPVGPCLEDKKLVIETDRFLPPGTYCEGIEIKKNAQVTLGAGIFVILKGSLKVDDTASIYGRDVSFYFGDKHAHFDFLSASTVNLGAPKTGPMAGILFYGNHGADEFREYKITSDNARTLLGTIYLPKGFFTVDANNPVADQSAYTAIVVRRLNLKSAPNLVLNTNYAGTDVPVPAGIGASSTVRLVQ